MPTVAILPKGYRILSLPEAPDILEQFRSPAGRQRDRLTCRGLLVVDEVHNLMPSPFGEDSELCKCCGYRPQFEHRLS